MSIEIACTCGKKVKVPDSAAGKKGKCPQCGAAMSIPPAAPAAAPAKKPESLELELEDVREAKRPEEAVVPVVQDLPGEPPLPKKKATSPPSSRAPGSSSNAPKPGVPAGDKIPCPRCGVLFDKFTPFCVTCGIDLSSGRPISGVIPGGGKRTKITDDFDENMPFWKITLQMIYQPWKVLGYFSALTARKEILIQMGVFYAVSMIAVIAAAKAVEKKATALVVAGGPSEEQQIADLEASKGSLHAPAEWVKASDHSAGAINGTGPDFVFKVYEPKETINAGEKFILRVTFCEPGPGKGIDGNVWAMKTTSWGGDPAGDEWIQARPAGQPGDYSFELKADLARETSFQLRLYTEAGASPEDPTTGYRGGFNVAWPSAPGWGRKVFEAKKANPNFDPAGETEDEKVARWERRKPALKAPEAWVKAEDTKTGKDVGDRFLWRVTGPTSVEADQPFSAVIYLFEPGEGDQPGEPMQCEVWVTAWGQTPEGKFDTVEMQAQPGAEPGSWAFQAKAEVAAATDAHVAVYRPGQKERAGRRGSIHLQWPSNPGWGRMRLEREKAAAKEAEAPVAEPAPAVAASQAKKILRGGRAVFGAILKNLGTVLLMAVIYTGAARFFGGGGSIGLMAVTLAYLTGFVNFASIAVFMVSWQWQMFVLLGLIGYSTILGWMALMKIYDLDMTSTLITASVGGLAFWVVDFAINALLGTAMLIGG